MEPACERWAGIAFNSIGSTLDLLRAAASGRFDSRSSTGVSNSWHLGILPNPDSASLGEKPGRHGRAVMAPASASHRPPRQSNTTKFKNDVIGFGRTKKEPARSYCC